MRGNLRRPHYTTPRTIQSGRPVLGRGVNTAVSERTNPQLVEEVAAVDQDLLLDRSLALGWTRGIEIQGDPALVAAFLEKRPDPGQIDPACAKILIEDLPTVLLDRRGRPGVAAVLRSGILPVKRRESFVVGPDHLQRIAAPEVDLRGVHNQIHVARIGQLHEAVNLVRPLNRSPDVRMSGDPNAVLAQGAPPDLFNRRGDGTQVLVGRPSGRSTSQVDLEVATAEEVEEITGKGHVVLDGLLAARRIDEVGRLAGTAVRAGDHRDAVLIKELLELRRTVQVMHG